jgi:hypothetical protein
MAKNWMSAYMNPSKASYKNWMKKQTGQFNPLLNVLTDQRNAMSPENDYQVQAYDKLLGALPSREKISEGYKSGLSNLAGYMQGVDTTRGAQGVSDIISSLGAGIGADVGASRDLATTAGTLSGVGTAGGDVMSKALMQGAAGRFAGLEAQRLGEVEGRQQELTLGKGAAESAAKASQREIAKLIAQTKGQQSAATLNPFDVGNAMMTFGSNQINLVKLLKSLNEDGKSGKNKKGGKPPIWQQMGFNTKPGMSEDDMTQMWNMNTGYNK